MGVLLLAVLIATWALYGTGRQIGQDARTGLGSARARATERSAAIRANKRTPKWKRRGYTAAHHTGKLTGATARGVRYAGRSAWTGAKWGVGEGRTRFAERGELREARPLSDADDPTEYRTVRDRVLHDRAERRGVGVPARKVRRIEKRDAREDERRDDAVDIDQLIDDTAAEFRAERDAEPEPTEAATPEPVEHSNPQPATEPEPRYAPMARAQTEHMTNGSTNGGAATMTAPTRNTNGAQPDGSQQHGSHAAGGGARPDSGEATTISGARAAWAGFEHSAAEQFDSATTAETEAKARQAGAAALLDTAAAAETDSQTCAQRAQMLAASMADADMGDPQAIADAETQQEFATSLGNAASALRAEAEASQAHAAKVEQLGAALRAAAEASQAHAVKAVASMNQRMARREAFFKD